ncbi:Uncharacterized protein OBRU01_04030 [Operophtera brumata]|uniref:C2H2-type domain-containing protein n=1 Tax=Operophtera brumata TaxID=104452 RepID=A0A0L7LN54_OPEBR|nr:Uncharacterized protein OBRU01_04030 [Operophtera brumata]
MDRLNQLRVGAEGSAGRGGDASLDSSSPPSEDYMSANESSKYFSLSDSTFDISPIKDVSLASAADTDHTLTDPDELVSNLSPISKKDGMLDSFKIGKQIEAANILSGGVDIFDDNDNSFDGDELVIDDNVEDDKSNLDKESHLDHTVTETAADSPVDVASKDTEVLLQIDGKNVDAIDIGNGLYLYRKAGQEELAAVQIITEDGQQAPSFNENAEGNLEVYEEFEIEVSKDLPVKEAKQSVKSTPVPIQDISKVPSEPSNKLAQEKNKKTPKEVASTSTTEIETEVKDPESKTELNLNGKMMKFSESRKSPVVGSFTPMTYHSTAIKEGKPLTKTMVDLQLHPSRHSDNVKKTIEVHTDSQTKKVATDECKSKSESQAKIDVADNIPKEISSTDNEIIAESIEQEENQDEDLIKDNVGISTTVSSNADRQTVMKKDDSKCTHDINKITVDDLIKPKVGTIEPTKGPIDNKSEENEADPLKTEPVEIKDSCKQENENLLKPKDSYSLQEAVASLLGPIKVDQILKSNTDKISGPCGSSSFLEKVNEDKEKVFTKHDVKISSKIEVNKVVVENTEPKFITVDQVLEKAKEVKENEQKEDKNSDNVPETSSSTIDTFFTQKSKQATKQSLTNPQKKSSETIDEVSSTSLLETQKSLKIIEVSKDSTADDKLPLVQEKNTSIESSIPVPVKTTSKQLKDIEKKEVKNESTHKETETKSVLEAEKNNQPTKVSEHKKEMDLEKNNSTAKQNESNVAKLSDGTENMTASQYLKSDEFGSKIEPKAALKSEKLNPVSKGIEIKTDSKIKKLNPIANSIESNTVSQTEKQNLNIVGKPIEPLTITEKMNAVPKVVNTTASTVVNTNLIEKKIDIKPMSQTNRFIPLAKGTLSNIAMKTGELNIEKKIEQMVPLQNEKMIPVEKVTEPKTYLKLEKLNPPAKGIMSMADVDQVNPGTKGFDGKPVSKTVMLNPVPKEIELKLLKNDKASVAQQMPKNKVVIITSNKVIVPSKVESLANKEINSPQVTSNLEAKPINNNHGAVPFGKWTDANRQEFVNKFKEIKVPASSNSKQIKNSNDLNRIDVLKKIDSQRSNTASAKAQDKSNVNDTVFSSKIAPSKVETKIPVKNEGLKLKPKPVDIKNNTKPEITPETVSSTVTTVTSNVGTSDVGNPETEERREVNVIDLIGKTIVDMLTRPVPMPMTRSPLDEPRLVDKDVVVNKTETKTEQQKLKIEKHKIKTDQQKLNIDQQKLNIDQQKLNIDQQKLKTNQKKLKTDQKKLNTDQQKLNVDQKIDEDSSGSLDDIEMKMNELHGIPFVERPPHELPKAHKTYSKSSKNSNQTKGAKNLLPATSLQSLVQENVIDLESDEEIIEHEPITGDVQLIKKSVSRLPEPMKAYVTSEDKTAKNEEPVITEKDFDKFARRNSITYENCLTVKFDGKEPANVVQMVKEKDATKVYPRNEMIRMDAQTKLPHKQTTSQIHANKFPNTKFGSVPEDPNNKNYQSISKIHSAYQSVMSAKRQMDRPITIIEDKPVKVVFMDANSEFVPNQLNVQGKELSPAKKITVESAKVSPQPLNPGVTDAVEDKLQDDTKTKTKHQRKQVLNPVEAPDVELIQPRDLGIDVSPKKKRKTDDNKTEKSPKNLVHKKSYLLGRAVPDDQTANPQDVNNPVKETLSRAEIVKERTVSAIDSLVKAAELLENQSVQSASSNPDSQQNTPVKRGRGRPRKYPLPEGAIDIKIASPSPQKKPRLIDAKIAKQDPISEEESSDDEQMIRENWTMGKINENIVCPICNKLFRSENVVFKHVKHCTGVSPTRSELEKRSPRRKRHSRDSDNKSFDSLSDDMEFDEKPKESVKSTPKKPKSKEIDSNADVVDIIVIEDTPVKEQAMKITEVKPEKSKISKEHVRETTEEKKEKAKKVVDEPVKEQTLQEIVDEKLNSKKLEESAKGKPTNSNMVEETAENPANAKNIKRTAEEKPAKAKKMLKTSVQRSSNLVCEFCGKAFRQLSYLSNHKLQHKEQQKNKLEVKLSAKLQVYSCEVCKKEFRKLHHLVQHRIIHNLEVTARTTRNSSSEQSDTNIKEPPAPKQDDTSAGFRCEPCDKSFRKLHHLVEHRETHDGINRQKINAQTAAPPIEKPPPPPQCDVCKKSFRKLHHLIEHKEQHHVEQVETSSEKSELDDKSVQSSLSTRDIIHECSLCYMVFPNEHSLNKHFIICQQKKKRQTKAKDKPENVDGTDIVEETTNTENSMDEEDAPKIVAAETIDGDEVEREQESKSVAVAEKVEKKRVSEKPIDIEKRSSDSLSVVKVMDVSEIPVPKEKEVTELKNAPANRDLPMSDGANAKMVIPVETKKIDDQHIKADLPKKISAKDKVAPSVTRRQKSIAPLSVIPERNPFESSDDDEERYMVNPDFKGKVFMKVSSKKRSSLHFERPNARDLINRRTSLQHPPKIPRLIAKAVEPKVVPIVTKNIPKPAKLEAASIDSDDSDVKYSFPETVTEQTSEEQKPKEKKAPRKSLVEKRKSLGGIAKRKSLGKPIATVNPVPVRIIKRHVEHRCDCGQLFNSAALLTRHTSLAHTPPRIRRRRSPPPGAGALPATTTLSTSDQPAKTTRKSSVKPEASNSKPARKSVAKFSAPETRKSIKPELSQSQVNKSAAKPKRIPTHRGVPVPEKMRKLMIKTQSKRGSTN